MTGFDARDPDFAERVRKSFAAQGIMSHIGATLPLIEPGVCEIELPYSDAVSQQHGFFHGGVIGTNVTACAPWTGIGIRFVLQGGCRCLQQQVVEA